MMAKQTVPTDTMQELWLIKDETAARFHTVAAYFEHLGMSTQRQPSKAKAASQKLVRSRRANVLQTH
jgi:hypothetical protein